MIKKFLYMLLIVMSSNVACSDIEPEPFVREGENSYRFSPLLASAIIVDINKEYFDNLSPRQLDVYKSQIDKPVRYLWMTRRPIEYAAYYGHTGALKWLILQGARAEGTEAIKLALQPEPFHSVIKPAILVDLLAAGATTDGLLIGAKKPLDYLRATLIATRDIQAIFPGSESEGIQQAIGVLEVHEAECKRWSPLRKEFCVAAVRGCRERGRIGAPSASAAELK